MVARVSMTPASRTSMLLEPDSRTAKPVPTRPGSTPTTRAGRPPDGRSDRDGLHDLVRDVVVTVDRLDVVQFLQCLDEAQHLGSVLALHAHRGLRDECHLGLHDRNPGSFKRPAALSHFTWPRRILKTFFFACHAGPPGVERLGEQISLADLGCVPADDAFAFEHPRDGARSRHVAAEFLERVPDLGGG